MIAQTFVCAQYDMTYQRLPRSEPGADQRERPLVFGESNDATNLRCGEAAALKTENPHRLG